MLKKDFIKLYSELNNLDLKKSTEEVERFLNSMKYALSKEKNIVFRKFGSFEVRQTKERMIVDPKNSENRIQAVPRKYVKFKVSRKMEDSLIDVEA